MKNSQQKKAENHSLITPHPDARWTHVSDTDLFVAPACGSFRHDRMTVSPRSTTVNELMNTVVTRTLDHFGVDHDIASRWGKEASP